MNGKNYQVGGRVAVSLFLGITALLVSSLAPFFVETPGTTSTLEFWAPSVAIALYLAFCQFWVAPRGASGLKAKLPTLIAATAPMLVVMAVSGSGAPTHNLVWLASGCLGSVVGALIAQWVTTTPQREMPMANAVNRARRCRNYLRAGFILLAAVALMILIGVIPLVVADTTPGFGAHPTGIFLGCTVVFDLVAVALLAFAVWRTREHDRSSKGTLGIAAFLTLPLAFVYCALGLLVGGHGPVMRFASVLLILCAGFGLITHALMIVTSVIVDRARLSAQRVRQLTVARVAEAGR